MNSKRKWLNTVLSIGFAASMVLTGCGSQESSASKSGGKNGEITLNTSIMLDTEGDEAEKQAWKSIADSYMADHPNVKINLTLQHFPGVEQHRAWVSTQLIGGTAPDIFTTRYIWDQEDLKKGLLTDLTPYYKEKSPYQKDAVWEDTFPKPLLQQLIGIDKTYASVPTYVNVVRVLYNKDLFAKAGITEVPKTWNEFMAAQEKLKSTGVVPFGFANSKPGDYSYSWSTRILTEEMIAGSYKDLDVNHNGMIEVNEYARGVNKGIIDIEKSPYKDVFPILKEWSKYWPKGYNGLDFNSAGDMFLRGETAMVMRTMAQSKVFYESSARKFEIGSFPLPYLTKENNPNAIEKLMEIGGVPAGNLAIPKNIAPEKLQAAVDFLKYTTSEKVQSLMAEKLYRTPILSNIKLPEKLAGFKFSGEQMELNIYAGEIDKNVTENNQKLGQLYLEGSKTLGDYIKELKQLMIDGVNKKMQENNWNEGNNFGIK